MNPKGTKTRCMVQNCAKFLEDGEEVRIGEKVFCKICGVSYIKGKLNL